MDESALKIPNKAIGRKIARRYRVSAWHYLTGKRPKGMQSGMWASFLRYRVYGGMVAAGMVVCFILSVLGGLQMHSFSFWTFHSIFWPCMIVQAMIPRFAVGRIVRKLIRQDFAQCFECGYCLTGLPEQHRCPECGARYELKHVRERWHAILGLSLRDNAEPQDI